MHTCVNRYQKNISFGAFYSRGAHGLTELVRGAALQWRFYKVFL
jgi:hypothetical protein